MEIKSQEKFSYVERIFKAMTEQGLKPSDITRKTGVHGSKFTRLEDGHDLSGDNLFKILTALDLVKTKSDYPYQQANRERHDLLETILNSGMIDAIDVLSTAIRVWAQRIQEEASVKGEVNKLRKEMEEFKKDVLQRLTVSVSSITGTDGEP